ncbi:MAG: HAD family hydrolase [Bryobacteraceae bacterium]|nr:HAD family hydrolase [Bryobacteraceae bacterium]
MNPRALLFDVDGTLYSQAWLRRRMMLRLLKACAGAPLKARPLVRALAAYRSAQEEMRSAAAPFENLEEAQIELASRRSGVEAARMRALVQQWMEQSPLDLLARCVRPGMADLLRQARERRLGLGVVSDYPCERKLEAMNLRQYFDVIVCAQDREVQCFKPHPRGLEAATRKLGVTSKEVVYIGDRPGVDDDAAVRAGISSILIEPDGAGMSRLAALVAAATCQKSSFCATN